MKKKEGYPVRKPLLLLLVFCVAGECVRAFPLDTVEVMRVVAPGTSKQCPAALL